MKPLGDICPDELDERLRLRAVCAGTSLDDCSEGSVVPWTQNLWCVRHEQCSVTQTEHDACRCESRQQHQQRHKQWSKRTTMLHTQARFAARIVYRVVQGSCRMIEKRHTPLVPLAVLLLLQCQDRRHSQCAWGTTVSKQCLQLEYHHYSNA